MSNTGKGRTSGVAERGGQKGQNDEATVAYIRHVLCSRPRLSNEPTADSPAFHVPVESVHELLPPLTSSNAVDIQLYAFLAVILSNYVQVWYNRITPDQEFVSAIVHIVAHCTRGLEQRLRQIDLEEFLLDELPHLLTQHVEALRISQSSSTGSPDTTTNIRRRFLALRPHIALEPVPLDADTSLAQHENELAWCLLIVNRLLPLLLPPEDLRNPCLDVLVSEIIAELIFRMGVCGKASEPWLIWDGIAKLLRALVDTRGRSDAAQTRVLDNIVDGKSIDSPTTERSGGWIHGRLDRISMSFWFVLQCLMAFWTLARTSFVILMQASAIPPRTSQARGPKTADGTAFKLDSHRKRLATTDSFHEKRPIIDMQIWTCLSRLLLLNRRSPWLLGLLSLLQWSLLDGPGQLCALNSRLDRLMSATFHERVLTSTWLPSILQAARSALFPNNAPAPARIPPTGDEIVSIRGDCAAAIVEAIPRLVQTRFFATADEHQMRADIEAELSLLADPLINKHLIISIIELTVVRLFPELAEE